MTDDLKFAGKLPVVINRNGGSNEVFAPIRSSSCDITVVSNKVLSDLYTNDKKGIKVKVEKLTEDEQIQLFEGYLTPNTYSQKLSPNLDNIDMTAIDPLALLKYIYVDDILEKSKTITMGELIAKALAAVKVDCNVVMIEDTVSYEGDDGYPIPFVNLLVQTNNFWDEGNDPSSVYDVVSECLRLFGYTMTFTGEMYMIYLIMADHTFGTNYRYFGRYRIEDGGYLTHLNSPQIYKEDYFFQHSKGDWTTIDDNTTISIDNTYDKISGVASTKIPNYSLTAFDLVSADNRDMYDVGDLNVQRNKIKGYKLPSGYKDGGKLISDDEWYYIWNGVYVNPDYELDIDGTTVNGYANINGAYRYMSGQTGHPDARGGILNFYGGEPNPVGTGRDPQNERALEVKECITVFAPDNGVPPEFLEKEDLAWEYIGGYSYGDGENWTEVEAELNKLNTDSAKYGTKKTVQIEGISYKQKYENITISEDAEQTLVIDLSQSYSRTGINLGFEISNYSDITNKNFSYWETPGGGEDSGSSGYSLASGTAYTYPNVWRNDSVFVGYGYFNNYLARDKNGKNYANYPLIPVWDRREVILYITTLDGRKYQFNGEDWVECDNITHDKAFYLKKLMNNKKIFTTDYQYDLIDLPKYDDNGVLTGYGTCSLNPDGFKYYSKMLNSGVEAVFIEGKEDEDNYHSFSYYKTNNNVNKYIDDADEGHLAIVLPAINSVNATVVCEIYHSSLLGTTGNSGHSCPDIWTTIYYEQTVGEDSGAVYGTMAPVGFCPVNATYFKAEHLNLDISLSVPESNLGQMFGESDIRYSTNYSKKFREAYDAPTFQVNTKHPIVAQSHSYVIAGNALADANRFSIGWSYNKIPCRPENYVMQGYKNFYSVIRRTYNRVLVPHKDRFSNCMCFIEAPDIPDVGNGRWLMVLSDSYDIKTNRHTISAVEDYDLNVNEIENYTVLEIPREARNPRYNLPSVQKKTVKDS